MHINVYMYTETIQKKTKVTILISDKNIDFRSIFLLFWSHTTWGLFSNVHFTNCLTNTMLSNFPFSIPYLLCTHCDFFEGKLTKYFSRLTSGKQRIKIVDTKVL